MIGRKEALALVRQRLGGTNLFSHCIAVECLMEALGHHLGIAQADIKRWALAGLLHDLDYAETATTPERHGIVAVEQLGHDVDDEVKHAILAHAEKVERVTLMDKALYVADPTAGFVVASALIRPDRSLAALETKSLLKRWKEKSFSRGARREQIARCDELGISREDFLALSLSAMKARAEELGFEA